MRPIRWNSAKILLLAMLVLLVGLTTSLDAQTKVNAKTGIDWVPVTGNGPPTTTSCGGTCTSASYGMPYTDLTRNVTYIYTGTGFQNGWVPNVPANSNNPTGCNISGYHTCLGYENFFLNWTAPILQSTSNGITVFSGAGAYISGTWRVGIVKHDVVFANSRMIAQMNSGSLERHSVGDGVPMYWYNVTDMGSIAGDDEGAQGLAAQVIQTFCGTGSSSTCPVPSPEDYFHGTVASTKGTGDIQPNLTYTRGVSTTEDGAFLLDITQGRHSGTLPDPPVAVPGSAYLNYYPNVTGTTLPLTTAWCTTTKAVTTEANGGTMPNGNLRDTYAPYKIGCTPQVIGTASPPIIKSTTVPVCIVGAGNEAYPEHAFVTDVQVVSGVQEVTISLATPKPVGSTIFQGGVCGQYLSFDASLSTTGQRTSYMVLGSLTGSDLIAGVNARGAFASPGGPGFDPVAYPIAYHLFPGAEIVRNNSTFNTQNGHLTSNGNPTLEPNAIPWAKGDAVEQPFYPVPGGSGLSIHYSGATPGHPKSGISGLVIGAGGTLIDSAFAYIRAGSGNPTTQYIGNGGLQQPPPLMVVTAPHGDFIIDAYASSPLATGRCGPAAMFCVINSYTGKNEVWNVFSMNIDGRVGANHVQYDQTQGNWIYSNALISQGYNGSGTTSPRSAYHAFGGPTPVGISFTNSGDGSSKAGQAIVEFGSCAHFGLFNDDPSSAWGVIPPNSFVTRFGITNDGSNGIVATMTGGPANGLCGYENILSGFFGVPGQSQWTNDMFWYTKPNGSLTAHMIVSTGELDVNLLKLGNNYVTAPANNGITSAVGGTGVTSVTCATATCTNLRGTYTVVGGTFATGSSVTLAWPTTTTAYACEVTQNGGEKWLGLGHGVASATGMTITNAVSIAGLTFNFDYVCNP